MWENPVFDRTQQDLMDRNPKAARNASMINRIEGNIQHLSDIFGLNLTTKQWARTGLPNRSDISRILSNIDRIREGYRVYATTPATPILPFNTIEKWNNAERILFDIKRLYTLEQSNLEYAGEFYAGEDIGVL